MFIFAIEQDIWVTRSNGLLKSPSIVRGYQLVTIISISMKGFT
jgi:hypothetical protein